MCHFARSFSWITCLYFLASLVLADDFPHFGVGGDSSLRVETIVQAVNHQSTMAQGAIRFYNDDGSPLAVSVDGGDVSTSFSFSVLPGEARQFKLTKAGPVVAGWFSVKFDGASSAKTNAIFSIYQGSRIDRAGVVPASTATSSYLIHDSEGENLDTGLALANPSDEARRVDVSLWNPSDGTSLASATVDLPPRGHYARFITEIFNQVPNIREVRGQISVQVQGSKDVAVMALRSNGGKLTTIPSGSGGDGVLPQIGIGGSASGTNLKTIVYLTSRRSYSTMTGKLAFFDDDGQPLAVSANGAGPATTCSFELPVHKTERITLSGDGPVRAGWAKVIDLMVGSSTGYAYDLGVSAVFQICEGQEIMSEAGVLSVSAGLNGMCFVEARNQVINTGVAIVNPASDKTIEVQTLLYGADGELRGTKTISLPPGGHKAAFVDELFPAIAAEAGSGSGFQGCLSLHTSETFAATALYQKQTQLAALPVHSAGVYTPTITASRLISTKGSPMTIQFEVDVVDRDHDLVDADNKGRLTYILIRGSSLNLGSFTVTAPDLAGKEQGTIRVTLEFSNLSASSGSTVGLMISIVDACRHYSNSATMNPIF